MSGLLIVFKIFLYIFFIFLSYAYIFKLRIYFSTHTMYEQCLLHRCSYFLPFVIYTFVYYPYIMFWCRLRSDEGAHDCTYNSDLRLRRVLLGMLMHIQAFGLSAECVTSFMVLYFDFD